MFLKNISPKNVTQIKEKLFEAAASKGLFWASSLLTLENIEPYNDVENGLVLLYEDATAQTIDNELHYINILQVFCSEIDFFFQIYILNFLFIIFVDNYIKAKNWPFTNHPKSIHR